MAVNDPFVMAAWGESKKVGDKVRTALVCACECEDVGASNIMVDINLLLS